MNKQEAKYLSDVLKAYSEGKIIQRATKGKNDWWISDYPTFEFDKYDYRIKPEPKYRPYANAEEFLKAQREHGPYILLMNDSREIPTKVCNAGIEFRPIGIIISYKELLRYDKWQDGTPCGILEE